MAEKRISLKDIAEVCGVSRNTVSLALRNSTRLKAETRERIQEVAREMGYAADPELGKLMTRLRERNKKDIHSEVAYVHTCGLVDDRPPHWQYLEPAAAYLETQGYRVRSYYLDEERGGLSEEELARILLARGVEGVLVGPMRPRLNRIQLPWEQFSAVAWGRALDYPVLPQVDGDAYLAMKTCFLKLQERGCRRIGAIVPSLYDSLIGTAYRSAFMGQSSLLPPEQRVEILDINRPDFRELSRVEVEDWLQRYQVDGIIAMNGDYENLKRLGFRMPEAFQFACCHLRLATQECPGMLSTDDQVGVTAAEQLLFAIQHGIRGSRPSRSLTLISGSWWDGQQ